MKCWTAETNIGQIDYPLVSSTISSSQNYLLIASLSDDGIEYALFTMHLDKASDPDGFLAFSSTIIG